jgi:putative membrane-bound dehydrogenase-like protein
MQRLRFRALLLSCFIVSAIPVAAQPPEPVVPDGFTIQKVAGYPRLHRPIFAGFDETGVLYVGESSGENLNKDQMLAKKPHWITRLEDTDDDGVFDKSTRFVDNITLPQGCLWYRGSLYAACPPSIWKFTDTDNDGQADQREEILTGFGFNGNACDTHGPFLSPTGRLYIVQGRHGHEFKDKDGNVYSKGKAGRIYSCRIDGSDVRVHAGGGFDNPVEVDFTEEGECIGTVNILYRDRGDCLMHWVEGGVYPREDQADCVAEFKWTGGLLGPIHNLGHVACSGIMRYRGVHFGDGFKDRWFFTEFNTHKVRYAELKRAGSTFTADVHEFLTCADGDFHPTDVLEDADGSLLVLNTGGWFRNGCPTSVVAKPEIYGGVYRVRKTDGVKVDDPRGKQLQLAKQSPTEWIKHLDDKRPAIREQALDLAAGLGEAPKTLGEMYRRNFAAEINAFNEALAAVKPAVSLRITGRALTAKSTAIEEGSGEAIIKLSAPSTRMIGLTTLADLTWSKPLPARDAVQIAELAKTATLPELMAILQLTATRCVDRETAVLDWPADALLSLVELPARREIDRFAEHALIVTLQRAGQAGPLLKGLRNLSPKVRRVALIALDQKDISPLTQEMVIPLLSSDDATLQQTALEVIARRPGWAAATLSLLKTWVREPELSADRANALRAFLLAQLGDAAVQGFVKEVLEDRETASVVRTLVWEVVQRSTIAVWPETWNSLVVGALDADDPAITLAALRVITQRSLTTSLFDAGLQRIAHDARRPLAVRGEAVIALGTRGTPLDPQEFDTFVSVLEMPEATAEAQGHVARALGSAALSQDQLLALTKLLKSAGPLPLASLVKAFGRSKADEVAYVFLLSLGENPAAVSLSGDELAGIIRRYSPKMQEFARPMLEKLGTDPAAQAKRLAELSPLLAEGDAKQGRNVFFGKKANCSACHAVAGDGGRVGPHLTTIGASRSPKDLLEAIVYPSASFVNGYRPYVVATDDGKVVEGVISAETTDTITLRTKDLQEIRLRRDQIDELREATTSIMPKGLDTQLTPDELRHLLAYLQSRK